MISRKDRSLSRNRGLLIYISVILLFLSLHHPARSAPGTAETGELRKSEWIEKEKLDYQYLLRQNRYEVLILPFEIRGFAIDRIGRATMARFLAEQVQRRSKVQIPSISLVARALGKNARTYADQEVYQLANDLKVKILIRGYVEHDQNEKMNVTLTAQVRDGETSLSTATKILRKDIANIEFSDERPPEEAFRLVVDQVIAWLPIELKPEDRRQTFPAGRSYDLPPTLAEFCAEKSLSPIENAWRLQLLGTLIPSKTTIKEQLFERSLVALDAVSPDSSDYALLRARAFYHLYRRPAAVAALPSPQTPQEVHFATLLEGDLPGVEKILPNIQGTVPRLIAEIETSNLRWSYDEQLGRNGLFLGFIDLPEPWQTIVGWRIQAEDKWNVISNLHVKKELDAAFPIEGPSAKSLAISRKAMGETLTGGEEVDTSVYQHWKRIVSATETRYLSADDSTSLVTRDHLDLLASFGEQNLIKKIILRGRVQGLYDTAIEILNQYNPSYRDHPELTLLRARAMIGAASNKSIEVKEILRREAKEHAIDVFRWEQGQTNLASDAAAFFDEKADKRDPLSSYLQDSPPRCFWNKTDLAVRHISWKGKLTGRNAKAIGPNIPGFPYQVTALNLLYDDTPMHSIEYYYDRLTEHLGPPAADNFLSVNGRRLRGFPAMTDFLARVQLKKGNVPGAQAIWESAIAETPLVWKAYNDYGSFLVQEGSIPKASQVFLSFPPFHDAAKGDTVAISNWANGAAMQFWLRGAFEESLPLFKIAAGNDTGSGAEMEAKYMLALWEKDYRKAVQWSLTAAKRYNDDNNYRRYIELLYAMGRSEMAWPIFETLIARGVSSIFSASEVGNRVAGKSFEDLFVWYLQDDVRTAFRKHNLSTPLASFLVDRGPDQRVADRIRAGGPEMAPAAALAECYFLFRKGLFPEFKRFFDGNAYLFSKYPSLEKQMIPIRARVAIKTENLKLAEELAAAGPGEAHFFTHLATAELKASACRFPEAIDDLQKALAHMPATEAPPFSNWYLLVDTVEWIYQETRAEIFQKLAVDLAKKYQRIRPAIAWAYAVEARYTTNPDDRRRALALALYLDRQSERIADFPEEEKAVARQWLENNNPFRAPYSKPVNTDL